MKYRYLVHTGWADEEFEIEADGYDITTLGGMETSVAFWMGVLVDGSLPGRATIIRQSIAAGYWIQTLGFGERIERTNNNGS